MRQCRAIVASTTIKRDRRTLENIGKVRKKFATNQISKRSSQERRTQGILRLNCYTIFVICIASSLQDLYRLLQYRRKQGILPRNCYTIFVICIASASQDFYESSHLRQKHGILSQNCYTIFRDLYRKCVEIATTTIYSIFFFF
jgi:hypothetical protein